MKTILCYGDSNTWGYPAVETYPIPNTQRYGIDVRWGSVMRSALGDGYTVIEEGLSGRTTVRDDPDGEHLNGKRYLLPCLQSHAPLDLVIILLGLNDLKGYFGVSAADVANGADELVDIVQKSETGPNGIAPRVLLISPPPSERLSVFAEMFAGSEPKSRLLAGLYKQVAAKRDCRFFDAGSLIRSSDRDGIHFDPESHQLLGRSLAGVVQEILN